MRQYIVNLAMKLAGIPYLWGGSNPRFGFDCSGFVIWLLQVFEILPSGDWTAQGLSRHFKQRPPGEDWQPGDLLFYGGSDERITHVMMYIGTMDSERMCIGASGGDQTTTTIQAAEIRGARVKVKPASYRRDFRFAADIEAEPPPA